MRGLYLVPGDSLGSKSITSPVLQSSLNTCWIYNLLKMVVIPVNHSQLETRAQITKCIPWKGADLQTDHCYWSCRVLVTWWSPKQLLLTHLQGVDWSTTISFSVPVGKIFSRSPTCFKAKHMVEWCVAWSNYKFMRLFYFCQIVKIQINLIHINQVFN